MNHNRTAATLLREKGYSYAMIRKELGVPLGTLSYWFKDKPFVPNAQFKERITSGQYTEGARRKKHRLEEIRALGALGKQEVGTLSKRDVWMLGLGLWIGEGSKTTEQLRLSNSNPQVIALWVRWLKEICYVEESQMFITLHIYSDVDEGAAKSYWMNQLQMEDIRFGKTQIDMRAGKSTIKHGRLPYGTAHISVRSMGDPEKGVKLYRRFKGWVSAILDDA